MRLLHTTKERERESHQDQESKWTNLLSVVTDLKMMTSKRVTFQSSGTNPSRVGPDVAKEPGDEFKEMKQTANNDKRHFRSMLARLRRGEERKRADMKEERRKLLSGEKSQEEANSNDFVRVVLEKTFPHSDRPGGKQDARKRKGNSHMHRRQRMKSGSPLSVAPEAPQQQDKSASANKAVRKRKSKRRKKGPQDEDDFWGHSGRCRSLEVVGVRSVLSSRTPSRCNTPLLAEAGGSSGGTLRGFRSREILLKIQKKLEYVKSHTLRTSSGPSSSVKPFPDHVGTLRAVRSLNEMSTLVSELDDGILDAEEEEEEEVDGGVSAVGRRLSNDGEKENYYEGAEKVDEEVRADDDVQEGVGPAGKDPGEPSKMVTGSTATMPDVCQTYSTSQQTTPYGIPHFFLGGEESTDENISSNSNNTPVDFNRDRLIGRGSFSVVCEGTFHHTKVAVKLFKDGCHSSYEAEKEILLHLRHPNIVQLLATCSGRDKTRCLVLERLNGGSLRDHLESTRLGVEARQLLALAADVAAALVHLHSLDRPILHLDVKSGNVLLDSPLSPSPFASRPPRAVLCDFGLSRRLRSSSSSSSSPPVVPLRVAGTPAWMPPEAVSGAASPGEAAVGTKADVYGLGMVAWEMASGERPFEGLTLEEVCDSIVLGSLPELKSEFDLSIPGGFCDFVRRCWREDPEERPTAEEALEDIRRMEKIRASSSSLAIKSNVPKPAKRSFLRFRRSKSVAAIAPTSTREAEPPPLSPVIAQPPPPPPMHQRPTPPEMLKEAALQKTPTSSPRKLLKRAKSHDAGGKKRRHPPDNKWVPRMGFPVTPMQLVRQRQRLRPLSASVGSGLEKSEGEDDEGGVLDLSNALREAVLRRRRTSGAEDEEEEEEGGGGGGQDSPWKIEDQF